jgi:hypothetical protein
MIQYDQATTKRSNEATTRGNLGKSGTGRWIKPPNRVIKINWDAAMDSNTGTAGLGTIARDHEGRVVAMSRSSRQHIGHPTTAETLVA